MKMGQKKQTTHRTKIKFEKKEILSLISPLPELMPVCDKICVEI